MDLQFKSKGRSHEFPVTLVKIQIPALPFPIALRPETTDFSAFTQIFLERDYKITFERPPHLIIDAGANIGLVSALLAHQFPSAKLLAVEPVPDNFTLLLENVRPYPNIQPIRTAVWKTPGSLSLITHAPDKTFLGHWGIRVQESLPNASNTVPATTITDLHKSTGLPIIDILKIDIEGAETEIFNDDAHLWLSKTNMLIIELHDRFKPGCTQTVVAAIEKFGDAFTTFTRGENTFFLRKKILSPSF